ncbi:class F sortase [Candidatus Nomurabacteria bacterium]|nr:class F sortase [Candidatus Nomurabacteria bacterium]
MSGLNINKSKFFSLREIGFWIISIAIIASSAWLGYRWYFFGDELPVPIAQAQADPNVDEKPVTKKQVDEHKVPASNPRYISIPKLGVEETRIFPTGVEKNGQLGAPANISDAVWYKDSALPGSGSGAVLIDAHNGGVTRNGVFSGLNKLTKGDEIIVERGDGKKITYTVVENESMSLEEANKTGMQKMMKSAEEDKEGLSLITCDGKWVPRYQQFDRRIMLRAVAK